MSIFFVTTEDGSPTAYLDGFEQEKMHHSGGALGETLYLYGPLFQYAFSKVETPVLLSLGTGLAYNEILAAAFSCLFDQDYTLDSYESNPELNQALESWILQRDEGGVPHSIYNTILSLVAEIFDIPQETIFKKLQTQFGEKKWVLRGAFESPQKRYHGVIYDFFSRKAMESFWTEEYLTKTFSLVSATPCAVPTYACTGALKKSLRANNFQVMERRGYLWKRTSTFAKKES